MNKPELIAALNDSRKALLDAIDDLTDIEMIESGVIEDWSVKDMLAHLTAWEAELIKLLAQARTTKRPGYFELGDTDTVNAKWYNENKNRPLDRVMADFNAVRKQTVRQVESYNDKDLNNPTLFKWLNGDPLWKWVASQTFEHEAEHVEQIKKWLEARK